MGKAMKTTLFGGLALKQRDRAICVVINELQLQRVRRDARFASGARRLTKVRDTKNLTLDTQNTLSKDVHFPTPPFSSLKLTYCTFAVVLPLLHH